MLPVSDHVPVAGSKISDAARFPGSDQPPATSTFPFYNNAVACCAHGACMLPVTLHVPDGATTWACDMATPSTIRITKTPAITPARNRIRSQLVWSIITFSLLRVRAREGCEIACVGESRPA